MQKSEIHLKRKPQDGRTGAQSLAHLGRKPRDGGTLTQNLARFNGKQKNMPKLAPKSGLIQEETNYDTSLNFEKSISVGAR